MSKKKFLSLKEMQELKALGLDTSDAWYGIEVADNPPSETNPETGEVVSAMVMVSHKEYTYTLQDIIEKLPVRLNLPEDKLKFNLEIWPVIEDDDEEWFVAYIPDESCDCDIEMNYEIGDTVLEAATDMLKWCLKNGYVK